MSISSVTFWLDRERKVFIENGSLLLDSGGTVLDVGCGLRPWESLFDKCNYIGVEVLDSGAQDSMKKPDFWFDGRRLPQESASVEMVLLTEVLEHSEYPQELLMEIHRVLKPSGTLLLTMPFIYQEHETPFDFRRFTVLGLKRSSKVADSTLCAFQNLRWDLRPCRC